MMAIMIITAPHSYWKDIDFYQKNLIVVYRSAREAEECEKRARESGEVLPTEKRFDSNCITPGKLIRWYSTFICTVKHDVHH